jgi:hypothetical protein
MPERLIPEQLLSGARRDFTIEHLFAQPRATIAGERALLSCILPPWQRGEVWDEARKRAFIEGVFLGLGTGYYVIHGADWDGDGAKPMSSWLIDGQQRISAIRDFVRGNLRIFDGAAYGDLNEVTARKRFLYQVFPCFELSYSDDEARLKELYERLNFGGVPHTPQDRERLSQASPTRPRPRESGSA